MTKTTTFLIALTAGLFVARLLKKREKEKKPAITADFIAIVEEF